jgi:hypothetical protein
MDAIRFDRLTATFARHATRRTALALLSGLGLSGLLIQDAQAACAANGLRCGRSGDLDCCSGKCVRKRGTRRKFCRAAADQGTCTIEQNGCGGSAICNGDSTCACYITRSGASFCGAAVGAGGNWDCVVCKLDRDCQSVTGKGLRCIRCDATCEPGLWLCAAPCTTEV